MKKIELIEGFIATHRAAIAAGVTATAFALLMYRNHKVLNEFLAKHNLTEEYYSLEG